MKHTFLPDFVAESNKIESILRTPHKTEIAAYERILKLDELTVEEIVRFVMTIQPNAVLRDSTSIYNVRVGAHFAPSSGPEIRTALAELLRQERYDNVTPYHTHTQYLHLHPFTDGNGRSGRAIWLHHMKTARLLHKVEAYGFLHAFYYQTLHEADKHATAALRSND